MNTILPNSELLPAKAAGSIAAPQVMPAAVQSPIPSPILVTTRSGGLRVAVDVCGTEHVYELPVVMLPDQLLLVRVDPARPARADVWKMSIARHRYVGAAMLSETRKGGVS